MFICISINPSIAVDTVKKPSKPISYGNTLYVGGSGPGNYTSIQDAVNDSEYGDTVFVHSYSSPYYENVVVNKSISLIGEDRDTTIIDGSDRGNVINISAGWVSISGFTIQYYGGHYWVYDAIIYISSDCNTITCNIISNNYKGIYLSGSSSNTISGNTISNNGDGIELYKSINNTFKRNTITNNSCGIFLSGSKLNTITGNTISNNADGIYLEYSFINFILGNNFFNKVRDAFFWNSFLNRWNHNYWSRPRILPKNIFGLMGMFEYLVFPWFNFDWFPAKEPYDIGV